MIPYTGIYRCHLCTCQVLNLLSEIMHTWLQGLIATGRQGLYAININTFHPDQSHQSSSIEVRTCYY